MPGLRAKDGEDFQNILGDGSSSHPAISNTSPANKRRSTFRRWLTNPVRKLSHGRLDKAAFDAAKTNVKKSNVSAKWKLTSNNEDMGNKSSSPSPPSHPEESEGKLKSSKTGRSQSIDLNGEDEDVGDVVEMPPPMQIQERSFPPVPTQDETQIKRDQQVENLVQHDQEILESSPSDREEENNDEVAPLSDTEENPEFDEMSEEAENALKKRQFVMQELVDTERDYVRDLGSVVEGYMELMKNKDGDIALPEDLRSGKDKMVFGNIETIYEWHRDIFHQEIEKCLEEPGRLGLLFRKYERKLHMYVVYCQNKPKSEFIVSEYIDSYFEELRQKLGHKLQLPDLLIKPVQRIMKYQLMLKDILKFTERAGLEEEADNLRQGIQIMHVVPKSANDMMNVGRLQGFDGKITAQGKLLLQDLLIISEGPPASFKGKELQVFLFEQIIIFSEVVGKRTQFSNPVYVYKNHLQVNKMSLEDKVEDGDPQKFMLRSKCPHQQGLSFIIMGATLEMRNQWVAAIRAILDTQQDFLRALQSPIAYQKELTKETSAPELTTLWNPTLRKTLSHPSSATTAFLKKHSDASDSARQRRSQREMKHKAVSDASDRRMTVAGTVGSTKLDLQSSGPTFSKIASLPCSPTDQFPETPPPDSLNLGNCSGRFSEQRKHSLPVGTVVATQSPPKSKKHFLEGFRNTLRSKTKTDMSLNNGANGSGAAMPEPIMAQIDSKGEILRDPAIPAGSLVSSVRRWSETNTSKPLVRPSHNNDLNDSVLQ